MARSPSEHPLPVICELLGRDGFAAVWFDRDAPETSGDASFGGALAVIVLWLANAENCAGWLERLRERFARTPLVLACGDIERRQLRPVLTAGVAGVVLGDELERALGACVRAVCAGQLSVPRAHWREIEPPVLSVRERQVLNLVAMGYMNRQIADRLFLSESTVKGHLSSAFSKLGVRSRSEAAELVLTTWKK